MGPPECNSARWYTIVILYAFHTKRRIKSKFPSTGACNLGVPGSNPGRDGYLSSWLCICSIQTVQRHGVYSAAYGTVHYKEPLKSFEIGHSVGHSPGLGLPSVAILP